LVPLTKVCLCLGLDCWCEILIYILLMRQDCCHLSTLKQKRFCAWTQWGLTGWAVEIACWANLWCGMTIRWSVTLARKLSEWGRHEAILIFFEFFSPCNNPQRNQDWCHHSACENCRNCHPPRHWAHMDDCEVRLLFFGRDLQSSLTFPRFLFFFFVCLFQQSQEDLDWIRIEGSSSLPSRVQLCWCGCGQSGALDFCHHWWQWPENSRRHSWDSFEIIYYHFICLKWL